MLDEWAAEQDPVFRAYFYKVLVPEMKMMGKTVIAVTHDDAYFDYAERVLRFDYGKIQSDTRQRSELPVGVAAWTAQIYEEADFLIDLLLNLDSDLEKSMAKAFRRGYWDVPYCLHPDNRRLTGAQLDEAGFIYWSDPGKIPFSGHIRNNAVRRKRQLSSGELLHMLSFNQQKYDGLYIPEEQLSTP